MVFYAQYYLKIYLGVRRAKISFNTMILYFVDGADVEIQ